MKPSKLPLKILKRYLKNNPQIPNSVIDIRAFDAIDFLSKGLAAESAPFSILDLGCSGGPTNAWVRNWKSYRWIGIDSDINAIKKLKSNIPMGSDVLHGYVYSREFCAHELPLDGPQLEIDTLLSKDLYDFMKIDIDGCDLHVLQGALHSDRQKSIMGIEIEVTYSNFRNSKVNFADCASLLIANDFELVAIESARRYSNGEIPSPYVWDIPAQTGMGKVFQGNQLWLRKDIPHDERSRAVGSLIMAAFGLSDWAWGLMQKLVDRKGGEYKGLSSNNLRTLFIPKFLGPQAAEPDEHISRTENFNLWRIQSQNREIEQPWFLSN